MPKIVIKEISESSLGTSAISNTVFIPIPVAITSSGNVKDWSDASVGIKLCSTEDDVDSYNKLTNASSDGGLADLNIKLIKYLISKYGYTVLVAAVNCTVSDGVYSVSGADIANKLFDTIADKALYDIRFICNGVINDDTFGESAVKCAETRGDCTALVSLPQSVYKVDDVKTHYASGSSNLSVMTPWFKCNVTSLNKETIPSQFGYLFAYGKMINNGIDSWYAVSGVSRGQIDELDSVVYDYSSSEVESLQARVDDGDGDLGLGYFNGVSYNMIHYVRPYGYVIWGNRTSLKNSSGAEDDTLSPIAYLNVRNLVSAVKKSIYNAARKYTFELNTEVLWQNFTKDVNSLLESMKTNQGIVGYKWERKTTKRKATIVANLTIVPIEAVEDFSITVKLSNDVADISESAN